MSYAFLSLIHVRPRSLKWGNLLRVIDTAANQFKIEYQISLNQL